MNDERNGSLGLDEVAERFAESEAVLREASAHLTSLIETEERSQTLAGSLSASATAAAEYNASAKALLDEAREALAHAREVLEAGSDVLSGSALADLTGKTAELHEQASRIEEQLSQASAGITESIEAQGTESRSAAEQTQAKIATLQEHAASKRALFAAVGFLVAVQVVVAVVIILLA